MGLTAAQRKNLKKKQAKLKHKEQQVAVKQEKVDNNSAATAASIKAEADEPEFDGAVEVEYVPESLPSGVDDDNEFASVFSRFQKRGAQAETATTVTTSDGEAKTTTESQDANTVSTSSAEPKPTKKERKAQKLAAVGVLKQIVKKPEIVEVWDATAADPEFLVYLKSYRNTVPVPRHWAQKKRYLQGKRGVDKKPFELPDFIQATGIAKLREAYIEREESKKLKYKGREKLQPKMGKMDINYQVLHDAFFKHQKKPAYLTAMGDMYYEGREFETKLAAQRPGVLSAELRAALGMGERDPPPYLANMQRVGPPISYPNLRIPGLNAPLPAGASWGFGPGEWGRAPLDQFGRPLYGDVFGTAPVVEKENIDRTYWGEIAADASDDESEEESDSESESEEEADEAPVVVPADGFESVTASGFNSVAAGLQTPDAIALRKSGYGTETPHDGFTILKEQKATVGDELMGVSHTYAIPSSVTGAAGTSSTAASSATAAGAAAAEPELKLSKRKLDSSKQTEKSKKLKF